MANDRITRRLAAIVAMDMVGYSRLMGEDEDGTIGRQKALRATLIDPTIDKYGGRIVKTTGDGLLVEFASAVDAVCAAAAIQRAMVEREADASGDRRIAYRIGVNLGEIVIDGDDILGDGVNVAARLEALADPGGICVSEAVFRNVVGKLDVGFAERGPQQVKNIAEPVHTYGILLDPASAGTVLRKQTRSAPASRIAGAAMALALAVVVVVAALWWQPWAGRDETNKTSKRVATQVARPTIAVLPFVNLSDDKSQEYFANGITADLITDLSKIRRLSVISRTLTSRLKGRKVDIREVGKALNVRYVIEGSVRRAGDRIRINAHLTDVSTGSYIWAERYEGKATDIFSLQDKVVKKVIGSLALELSAQERRRLAVRGTDSVAAHDFYLRGLFQESRFTREGNRDAMRLYERALAIDPNYALPYTRIANILELNSRNGWSTDIRADIKRAVDLAQKAADLDPHDPRIQWSLGRATARLRTPEALKRGIRAMQKAIDLDPYFADAYAYLTILYIGDGRAEDGLRSIRTAMKLNPRYPFWYLFMRGMAHFFVKDYPKAVADFEAAAKRSPTAQFVRWCLAAAYVQAGRIDDAKWQVEELKSMGFRGTISTLIETQPILHPPYLKIYKQALRKAGIPD